MTTESTLGDVLASQFDEHAVHDCLRDGDRNTVYEVSVDGQPAVCKTTDSQPAMLAREAAVLDAVAERTPVPVPERLGAGDGYLVLERARGGTYDSDDARTRRHRRLRAVGKALGRLHRATADWFDGHGALERTNDSLTVARPTDWPDRLRAFVEDWAAGLAGTRDADVGTAVLEFVKEYRRAFADRPAVLVHGEPSPDHVRFEDSAVVALFDWEIAQAAPGAFDLVWAERDFLRTPTGGEVDSELRTALHDGYATERPLSPGSAFRCEVYRAAFAMRDLKHADDAPADAGIDGDDRRASLREYVFDRLDAAESMDGAAYS